MPGESILLTPPCLSLQMLRAHYVHSSQHHLSSEMPSPRSCMHCCSAGSSPGSMPWCLHIRTCCPSPSWTSMASRWHFVCVGGAGDIKLHLSHFSAYGATIIRAPFPYYFLSCLLPFSSLTHTVRHYLRPLGARPCAGQHEGPWKGPDLGPSLREVPGRTGWRWETEINKHIWSEP